jgi:O-antigen ligase
MQTSKSLRADERRLKILIVASFLPEGLSFFIGDFRLPLIRILIIIFLIPAISRYLYRLKSSTFYLLPSDAFVLFAAGWMIISGVITDGAFDGIKGAGALALEFTGTYCVFRQFLRTKDSAVRLIAFSRWPIIVVICIALLDPLLGRLFTHDFVAQITGYPKYMQILDFDSDGFVRNGVVRAMGPLEHSIMFGSVCAWFGILTLCVFRLSAFNVIFQIAVVTGLLFSQSKAPILAYVIGVVLISIHFLFRRFAGRWKLLLSLLTAYLLAVFSYSGSPVSTLLRYSGVSPEAGWYREIIWASAGSIVLRSPVFGWGLGDWQWQSFPGLVGGSVDSLWLELSMLSGIPGCIFVFLTLIGTSRRGTVDGGLFVSQEEQRLFVALGIVTFTIIFLGFTVHFWGTCWILLGAFPAIRASLAEAEVVRGRMFVLRKRRMPPTASHAKAEAS